MAAILLGAAIQHHFPQVAYAGSIVDHAGFRCVFFDNENFDSSYLHLLESTMKQLAKSEPVYMEMLAANAKEMFAHHNQSTLAEKLAKEGGVVGIAKLGDFYDLTEPFSPCKTFSLLGFTQKKGRVEIQGVAFEDDRQKRTFLKKWAKYPKNNGNYLAKQLDLYEDEDWHPRGIALKKILTEIQRELLEKEGYCEVATANPKKYFENTQRSRLYFFENNHYRFSSFENPISCLQLLRKWIKIFGFEHRWELRCAKAAAPILKELEKLDAPVDVVKEDGKESRLDLFLADGLGRFIPSGWIQWKKGAASGAFAEDLKQFACLLLERFCGKLPFWLAPEQVVLIPQGGVDTAPIAEIFEELRLRYTIADSDIELKEKLHRALHRKVPYVMVFGKREENTQEISVRAYGSSQDMKMTLNKMKALLAGHQA